jgi:hypothetical protein
VWSPLTPPARIAVHADAAPTSAVDHLRVVASSLGAMIPGIRDAVIGNMIAVKLYVRRALRRWRAGARKPAVLRSTGDSDSDDCATDTRVMGLRSKMRGAARLPARPPDRANSLAFCAALFVVALAVRGFHIAQPAGVVFDELHFGKFVKAYWPGGPSGPARASGAADQGGGRMYFDIHPPYDCASVTLGPSLILFRQWCVTRPRKCD